MVTNTKILNQNHSVMRDKHLIARMNDGAIVIKKTGNGPMLFLEAMALYYPSNGKIISVVNDLENDELVINMHNLTLYMEDTIISYINDLEDRLSDYIENLLNP